MVMTSLSGSGICGYCNKTGEQMVAFEGEPKWMCSACLFKRVSNGVYDSRSAGEQCNGCGETGHDLYCQSCTDCDRAHGCSSCGDDDEDVYCSSCGACEESHSNECNECYSTAEWCSDHANTRCSDCGDGISGSLCGTCRRCEECDGDNGEGVVCRVCFDSTKLNIPDTVFSEDGNSYNIDGMEVSWS
jgi:hypothetical protein